MCSSRRHSKIQILDVTPKNKSNRFNERLRFLYPLVYLTYRLPSPRIDYLFIPMVIKHKIPK